MKFHSTSKVTQQNEIITASSDDCFLNCKIRLFLKTVKNSSMISTRAARNIEKNAEKRLY